MLGLLRRPNLRKAVGFGIGQEYFHSLLAADLAPQIGQANDNCIERRDGDLVVVPKQT